MVDVMGERYKNGKPKLLYTKRFENESDAVEARKKLEKGCSRLRALRD